MIERLRTGLPLLAIVLLLVVSAWIYWPGQTGPALMDDRSSVLVIGDLKQQPELLWDYVTGDRSGLLGRPVSMLSFVLEKLFLEEGLASSKRVNICLHVVNGALVIWLFGLLFRHLGVSGYRWLALVLGAGWLLSPLYVSTVLYVVQRMAMLSATFMLGACISYVYWRERLSSGRFSVPLFALIWLNLLLALFAKENAVVAIPVLLLLEALWFQFRDEAGRPIVWLRRITLSAIAAGGAGVLAWVVIFYDRLAAAFRYRPFTLDERLLTQTRVLWDYVDQLVTPEPVRMGLYHDDVVTSHSLLEPVTTSYALAGWIAVLLLFCILLRWSWGRYVAVGAAWFLVGHSLEASVFSLEMYFEHRNYFPGIGLFLLLGTLYMLLVRRWPELVKPLLAYLGVLVLYLASLTSSQVQIWSSHPLLILSHLNGHPESFRANADMAVQMANLEQIEAARRYSAKAYAASSFEREGDMGVRDLALSCIANVPVDSDQIANLGSADPRRPFSSVITLLTMVRLLQDNTCPEFDRLMFADRMVELYIAPDSVASASPNVYHALAVLENSLERWSLADTYIDRFLKRRPSSVRGLLMKLHFNTALGNAPVTEATRDRLLALDKKGKLTEGQKQTLSLYLEN